MSRAAMRRHFRDLGILTPDKVRWINKHEINGLDFEREIDG